MPSDKEWRDLVEVLGEVADTVTDERVKEIEEEEGNPENPAEGEAGEATSPEEEKKPDLSNYFTKEQVEQIVRDRLSNAKAKEEQAAEKARREAAEKAAEENEQYAETARLRKERIDELETEIERLKSVEEKATAYETTLDSYAQARIDELNLQKGVINLLAEKDAQGKLDWLSENGEDFATHERVAPADSADETGTPEADEAARGQFAHGFARDF